MIDWRLANIVAQGVASAAPSADPGEAGRELEEFAARSASLVAEYTGLAGDPPAPETVDRSEWVALNLAGLRGVLDPVADKLGAGMGPLAPVTRAAGGALLAVEVGAISGYLAGRVLGQYEFPVLEPAAPARLLFVGPNLAHTARTTSSDPGDLLRWVALHETTHALQFGGVPWLRVHLAERVRGLLGVLDTSVDLRKLARLPSADDVRALVAAARGGEIVQFVVGPERRAQLDELQGLMALIEGHAEHVMDAVGAEVLPDLASLRERFDRRRRERSGILALIEKIIGLELKLRQYEQGKRFVDSVAAEGGVEAINRAWEGPQNLPSAAELDDPSGWLRRVS